MSASKWKIWKNKLISFEIGKHVKNDPVLLLFCKETKISFRYFQFDRIQVLALC